MRTFTLLGIMGLLALSAQAVMLQDFEGGDYVGPGSLVADPTNAGNTVLELALADNGGGYFVAQIFSLDITEMAAAGGTVTMDIYDYGKIYTVGNNNGARWGITGDLNAAGIGLIDRTWLGSEQGYAYNTSEYDNQTTAGIRNSDWHSAMWTGVSRQVNALDTDTGAGVADNDGDWRTWSCTVDADGYITDLSCNGTVVIKSTTVVPTAAEGGRHVGSMKAVWASAGKNNTFGLDGVLIDNVTFESAEASFHPGDANGDGAVNIQDFILLKQNYGTATGATWAMGDFNADGAVNIQDFIILKQNYGYVAP